ncbi:hypothetical protein [Sphingobacterium sp.]|uniref:hypothetical protein n=1 Tax=Sphingobacterium sp. TaxID=341027 RepID=UPI00289D3A75|nr:hypothetical protein [Sphingobacterium sp.]
MNFKLSDENFKTYTCREPKKFAEKSNNTRRENKIEKTVDDTDTIFNEGNENNKKKQISPLEYDIGVHDKLSIFQINRGGGKSVKDEITVTNGRKVKLTKATVKRYRVIVRYVEVSEDERKIKRAIIEDILKNS